MTDETVQLWTEPMAAWRASGEHADAFAEGKGFKGSTLRFWTSKLRRLVKTPTTKAISFVPVARSVATTGVVSVVAGDVRVEMPRVDEVTLRLVLRVLFPADVEVFVATEPIDLRWSFDRLAGCVQERVGRSSKGTAIFVFFGRRSRDRIKILFHDGSGYCVFYKRLDRGTFTRPTIGHHATSVTIDTRELDILFEGLVLLENKRRVH